MKIRVTKIKMPDSFPVSSVWCVIYRHPVHGVLIRPCRDHPEAIKRAEQIRRTHDRA